MSDSSTRTTPQIQMNGAEEESAAAEEQISSGSLDAECLDDGDPAEKETQVKMQSVFQQVRRQIRSQYGLRTSKGSMLELVQRLKDRQHEVALESREPEGSEEKVQAENQDSKHETHLNEEALCAVFDKKFEESKKALMAEFDQQISQAREDMQAYVDQALKDLEAKMQSWQPNHLQRAHPKVAERKDPDKKQKLSAATLSRRGRVLTRTMTAIIPKTCAPVIVGPRAKSETLISSKGESSRFQLKEPLFSSPGNKPFQSRKPLPPAGPPLHQYRKPVRAKPKAAN